MISAGANNPAVDLRRQRRVSVLHTPTLLDYDASFPYLPGRAYPELARFGSSARQDRPGGHQAEVFDAVRRVLALGCDRERFGTADWNPLGAWIAPGMRVCIKPNLVMHANLGGDDLFSSIAHPSVIAAAAVYAALALDGDGEITVCDSPQWNCDMDEQLRRTGLDALCAELGRRLGVRCVFADLRMVEAVYDQGLEGLVKEVRDLPGDPRGYTEVDLGRHSAMEAWDAASYKNVFGSDYDRRAIRRRHRPGRHVYVVANSVLGADCVINLPKFKTHKKAGLTCAMKNLVGAIGDKNCLPHFRIGYGCRGDESAAPPGGAFKRFVMNCKHRTFWLMNDLLMARHSRLGYHLASGLRALDVRFNHLTGNRFVYRDGLTWGNWRGNRTIGPLTVDLNTIVNYVDADGRLGDRPARSLITLVDGVIAGEGDGPLSPTARPLGVLMFSENSLANDTVVARLMGFDRARLHTLCVADELAATARPLGPAPEAIEVLSNDPALADCLRADPCQRFFDFVPHRGWADYVELDAPGREGAHA